MPAAQDLRERRLTPRPVTTLRRWLGMGLDFALFGLIMGTLQAGLAAVLGSDDSPWILVAAWAVAWVLVFVLPARRGPGASIGQQIVWLAPRWFDGQRWVDGTVGQRLAHASVIPGACLALITFDAIVPDSSLSVLTLGIVGAAIAAVPFTRGKRGIAGMVTGSEMRDSRDTDAGVIPTSAGEPAQHTRG